ncbi:hypothetical protein MKX01_016216 [Papaver californicum]|nr:hypothetical protein MKX01_016216 [Papaver californicum]
MASSDQEIASELLPLLRVYKNGRVERLIESEIVPPSLKDANTGVSSKDITISTNPSISARIYIPSSKLTTTEKLPLLVYFHGGGFCIESSFSLFQQPPENPLPIAYEDCWTFLQWVLSHTKHDQPQQHSITHGFEVESWLKNKVNFDRVFLGGDSAGANIAHNIASYEIWCKWIKCYPRYVSGSPIFLGSERIGSETDMDQGAKDLVERI